MPRLDYTDYDYDSLVEQLTNVIKLTETWKDNYQSSTGQTLIQLFSYIANLLMYYIERRAQEGYLGTAQLRTSLVNLVQLVGYKPSRKVSATGTLKFSISAAHTDISIPDNTLCQGGDLYFLIRTTQGGRGS